MVSVWRASAGTVGREDARTRSLGESKSRNKVSVGEPAEGSLSYVGGFDPAYLIPFETRTVSQPAGASMRMKRRPGWPSAPLSGYLLVLNAAHGGGLSSHGLAGLRGLMSGRACHAALEQRGLVTTPLVFLIPIVLGADSRSDRYARVRD